MISLFYQASENHIRGFPNDLNMMYLSCALIDCLRSALFYIRELCDIRFPFLIVPSTSQLNNFLAHLHSSSLEHVKITLQFATITSYTHTHKHIYIYRIAFQLFKYIDMPCILIYIQSSNEITKHKISSRLLTINHRDFIINPQFKNTTICQPLCLYVFDDE